MPLPTLVSPGTKIRLSEIDPETKGDFTGKSDPQAATQLNEDLARLVALQDRLYAEQKQAVLVVLQAMDTAGKDGVLRKVVGPLDSRGVNVASFKAPNEEERAHDYLWRCHEHAPRKGQMVFFNRSHYEDVLVVRVKELVKPAVWKRRFDHINAFEKMLSDEGTHVIKIYLHISKDEQKRRLEERLADPERRWKFDPADLDARAQWDAYMDAYEDAISRTSTKHAPWHVVPANRKWFRDLSIARILVELLESIDPQYPPIPDGLTGLVIPD